MEIYYTTKNIWWSNKGNNFLENSQFNNYLPSTAWTKISGTKGINWTSHYTANFYATNNFHPTYFKVVQSDHTYYFFVDDYVNDGAKGKFFKLELDFYNTYTRIFISNLWSNNPRVMFKRKHCNRFEDGGGDKIINPETQSYLFNVPEHLEKFVSYKYPTKKEKIDYPQSRQTLTSAYEKSGETTPTQIFHDGEWYDGDIKGYFYLRIKRPESGDWESSKKLTPYLLFPIAPSYSVQEHNNWKIATRWPSDYVVDLISSPIPPTYFGSYATIETAFSGIVITPESFFGRNKASILMVPVFNQFVKVGLTIDTPLSSIVGQTEYRPYSLTYYTHEPMLSLPPFYDILINDKHNVASQYSYNYNGEVRISLYTSTGNDILTYIHYGDQKGKRSLDYNASSKHVIEINVKHPFTSSVLNNYILNNANSMDTSISLAKQQQEISDKFAKIQGGFGMTMGIAGMGLGVASGVTGLKFGQSDATSMFGASLYNQGMGQIISGASQLGNAAIGMKQTLEMNEFNTKAAIANMEAKVADVGNKPPAISGTYEQGTHSLYNRSPMFYTSYTLPSEIQKTIFLDFYWYGYIFNGVDYFQSYNNRRRFNYFEIADVFPFVNKYTNFPKRICRDIALQVESGIRLWKDQTKIGFDGTIDNRETKYND